MISLMGKRQVDGEIREQMLIQYLKRSLASIKYGIAGGCLLAYYELEKHAHALVLAWMSVFLVLNIANYFYAKNALKIISSKLNNPIYWKQFIFGFLLAVMWLSFLFIFKRNETSGFEVFWSGAIIFITLVFYMDAISYSRRALIVYPCLQMLGMFVYLYGFTSIADVALLVQMSVALCLGTLCVLLYGMSSYKLNQEISELIVNSKHWIAQLDDMLIHDNLTQLYNRRYFDEQLIKSIKLYQRNEQAFCVALMDIDFFKNVNDVHGHLAGDQILVALGSHIKSMIRVTDLFARYGGEEFAMIMPITTLDGAQKILDSIRLSVANQSYGDGDVSLSMTVSFGHTEVSKKDTAKTLLARADKALYQAKAQGRNRVVGLNAIAR